MTRIPEFPEDLDPRQKEIADKIAAGPRGRIRGPLALWLYSPDLAERAQHLGEFLRFGTGFDKRISELAILVCAAELECNYVWAIHEPIARDAGLSATVIETLKAGKDLEFQHDDERIVYTVMRQLLDRNKVDQTDFDALIDLYGERGIVELTGIMGYYAMGAHMLNAVEIAPPDGSDPFGKRN